MCKELGRLTQGYNDVTGTTIIQVMTHKEIKNIPADQTVMYTRIVVDYQPQKDDLNRVCITVDGKIINYIYELTNRTADLTPSKMLWNSTISTPGASFCTADVKNFCLETPMERYEYMHIHIKLIPKEIIDLYNLRNRVKGDYIYMDIRPECTAYPKPATSQTIYCAIILPNMDTTNSHTHQVYGNMRPVQCGST